MHGGSSFYRTAIDHFREAEHDTNVNIIGKIQATCQLIL